MATRRRWAFISGMAGVPWGGSELLWSQTATRLAEGGNPVLACVQGWPERPFAVEQLARVGVEVVERRIDSRSFLRRGIQAFWRRREQGPSLPGLDWVAARRIAAFKPDAVVISHGGIGCGLEWMEWCRWKGVPYVSVAQANAEIWWPEDGLADRMQAAHEGAKLSCFVAQGNLRLFETQIGGRLRNARVVWNPCGAGVNDSLPWPATDAGWRLACVARLDPRAKGQDLLLGALARVPWRERGVTVSLFGDGPMRRSLERVAKELGLEEVVRFEGHVPDVTAIWRRHHLLVMPSRYEGLPIALVEAFRCGRPAVVTAVGGCAECVDEGETGFVSGAVSVEGIHQALERAWEQREAWEAMGREAARRMASRYPADPVGEFAGLLDATF